VPRLVPLPSRPGQETVTPIHALIHPAVRHTYGHEWHWGQTPPVIPLTATKEQRTATHCWQPPHGGLEHCSKTAGVQVHTSALSSPCHNLQRACKASQLQPTLTGQAMWHGDCALCTAAAWCACQQNALDKKRRTCPVHSTAANCCWCQFLPPTLTPTRAHAPTPPREPAKSECTALVPASGTRWLGEGSGSP
jgi:hypothetical protein